VLISLPLKYSIVFEATKEKTWCTFGDEVTISTTVGAEEEIDGEVYPESGVRGLAPMPTGHVYRRLTANGWSESFSNCCERLKVKEKEIY
jgi:hypothetical protein